MASRGSAPSWLLGFTLLMRAPACPNCRPRSVGRGRSAAAKGCQQRRPRCAPPLSRDLGVMACRLCGHGWFEPATPPLVRKVRAVLGASAGYR